MANITIEYMILIPVLILQIFLLPYATSLIMSSWSTSVETLALQDASSRVGSSIQQLYYFVNHATVPSGNITSSLNIPRFINNYAYTGNAMLTNVVSGSSPSKVLRLTLKFMGNSIFVTSSVDLGQNVYWTTTSSFMSNSTTACIQACKYSNNTILLFFGS
jgi:hypothetical protein